MDQALRGISRQQIPEVLVGFDHADDAGVYLLRAPLALVQTVDFFSPIVDDAFVFGQIAAANALSDIYAMGGVPRTALAIVGFPIASAEPAILRQIMEGGLDKLNECGVALLGGHSVRDDEVKFGYAITGTIDPAAIRQNSGALPGDRVLLTKALGTGLVSTAVKKGQAAPADAEAAIASMVETNRRAAEVVGRFDVRAMTDVTGFGLLGHAHEVARASKVTIAFDHSRVPLLPGALEYSARGYCAGGLKNNREFFAADVTWAADVDEDHRNVLFDPQTSGGLLIFASEAVHPPLAEALREAGVAVAEVGLVSPAGKQLLTVS